ncbi:MAG: hypothetical protein R3B70_35690 [Polyangiaceae bacterium]
MNRSTLWTSLLLFVLAPLLGGCVDSVPDEDPRSLEASALGTGEQCDTIPANSTFVWGDPHVYVSSTTYTNAGCTDSYIVVVNYKDPAPLPGTYMSWADVEPSNALTCGSSRLRMLVWDTTTSPYVYKGTLLSTGEWVANPDPAHDSAPSGVCRIQPIKAEDIGLVPGRRYRFAMRAETQLFSTLRKRFAFANAPLPGRAGLGAAGDFASGWYMAILASSGADMSASYPWPTVLNQYRLTTMNARVDRGGDIVFQDGIFLNLTRSFTRPDHPNFGMSNADIVDHDGASLNGFSCPQLEMTSTEWPAPSYSYSKLIKGAAIGTGFTYCALRADNRSIDRLKVIRRDTETQLVVVGFAFDRLTARTTYGCTDGFCDSEARLAGQFLRTGALHAQMSATSFDLLHHARSCIEQNLQRSLPVPLSMELHGEDGNPPLATGGANVGAASNRIIVAGFQGIIQPGNSQVEADEDVRFDLHEAMHVYNRHFLVGTLPGWFNEGMAIQIGTRLTCGGDPRLMPDGWRSWSPGATDPHGVGSQLFWRLEQQYGCDVDCAADIWRTLVDQHGADPEITSPEIRVIMEARVGAKLSAIFMDLGIPYN